MALDPDYIPLLSECGDCGGTGDFYHEAEDDYEECLSCDGTGEVDLRE